MRESALRQKLQPCCAREETERQRKIEGAEKLVIGLTSEYRRGTPSFSHPAAGYYDSVIEAGGVPVVIPPVIEETWTGYWTCWTAWCWWAEPTLTPATRARCFIPRSRLAGPPPRGVRPHANEAGRRAADAHFGGRLGMQLLNVTRVVTCCFIFPKTCRMRPAPSGRERPEPPPRPGRRQGSMMERVYGEGEIRVSSMHHMAVDDVATGFAVTARCPDGVIEAIESTMDDWFALGVQFHPENGHGTKLDIGVFEEFMLGIIHPARCRWWHRTNSVAGHRQPAGFSSLIAMRSADVSGTGKRANRPVLNPETGRAQESATSRKCLPRHWCRRRGRSAAQGTA